MALGKKSSGSSFKYEKRSADAYKKRATQTGSGSRDQIFEDGVKLFQAEDGDNIIRVIPPTWEDPEHFGYEIFVHYNVGPDNAAYLCPQKMKGEACPICEERARVEGDGDEDYLRELKPSKRVVIYLVNREKEKEGAMLWAMSWTLDKDLCKLVVDKRTGEVYQIDDPDDGYDVEFTREGKGLKTKYSGLAIGRKPTPLDCDAALEHAVSHPIPELLVYYDYDHILAAFSGKKAKKDDDEDAKPARRSAKKEEEEDEKPARRSAKKEEPEDEPEDKPRGRKNAEPEDEPEDEKPAPKKRAVKKEEPEDEPEDEKPAPKKRAVQKEEAPELTYAEVQALEEDDLLELISGNDDLSGVDPNDFNDLEELANAVCEALGLEKPKKSGGLKERLANLKRGG